MPSLMHLPQELHLQIIQNLKPFPETMLLRLTNGYFYNLMSPLSDEEMKSLQHKHYCVKRNLRYCIDCNRLRPGHNFVPYDISMTVIDDRMSICIECGMHDESYPYPHRSVFKSKARTRVMCDDCSDMPKGSLRRHEDLCQECWSRLEKLHKTFPLWKKGLSEEEVLGHQVKLFRSTARLHHQAYCRVCLKGFRGCESLIEAAEKLERN